MPEYDLNLAAQYRRSLGALGGVFARAEYILTGGQFFDDFNTLKQKPYHLVNFRLGWEREHFDLYVFLYNALDERFREYGYTFLTEKRAMAGTVRLYGVEARWRF